MVDEAREAVLQDTAERARSAGFDRVRIFSTTPLAGLHTEQTQRDQPIGQIVATAAERARGPVCYAGSGMPAMTIADWSRILATAQESQATSNRIFSCDWLAVPDGRALSRLSAETIDNSFALRLRNDAGLSVQPFDRSPRSLLDLDTPTDLAILQVASEVGAAEIGPALSRVLTDWRERLTNLVERVRHAFDVMTRRDAELMLMGRVSGSDWSIVDRDTSCRVRVLSEERGLRGSGRRANSLIGALLEAVGPIALVSQLTISAAAVLWDTRPLYSHLAWRLPIADRFAADLGDADAIQSQPLRELVEACADPRIVIGGHSLVSGGLRIGVDTAWSRREQLD